jgi:hypothetical protein
VKSSKAIVVLLVLNFGLFLGILVYFLKTQVGAPLPAGSGENAAEAAINSASHTAVVEKVIVVTNELKWAQLESEDYKTYIARLRSISCPEQTIRDIIIADLDKLLAPEIQALRGRRKDLKYWDSEEEEMANNVDSREVARKAAEVERRKRDILRELVNADLLRERLLSKGEDDYYERRLNWLPEDRRQQLRGLLERYDDEEQRIRDKEIEEGEPLSITDRAQLRVLKQKREAELNSQLSPEERVQYDLWISPTANNVRYALYGMNATEQEFQSVYQARKSFEDRWSRHDPDLLDSASRAQMEQDKQKMEETMQQSLGEQRYAEYKRGEDEDFHRLNSVVSRFKLPREKAGEVYGYKKVALDFRAQVRSDPQLTLQQKDEALRAIAGETEASVKAALGDKAFRYYIRSGLGEWMRE